MSIRALPIGLPPVSRETLGSYLHRLADANHITITAITQELNINRRYRRSDDDPTHWTTRTVLALAALTGRPPTTLTLALPALYPFTTTDIASAAPSVASNTLCVACRCCTASKGIHGLVIQRAARHDYVCLRHRQWLHGPEQHPLHVLPELCTANRRHRRLLHQHDTAMLDTAFTRAQQLIRDWLHSGDQRWLQPRWRHRLDELRHDPHADPYRPNQHRIELATYPEAVTLTTLLTSAYWRNHPKLHDEAERRLQRAGDTRSPYGRATLKSGQLSDTTNGVCPTPTISTTRSAKTRETL
jgi:hypothetical protein